MPLPPVPPSPCNLRPEKPTSWPHHVCWPDLDALFFTRPKTKLVNSFVIFVLVCPTEPWVVGRRQQVLPGRSMSTNQGSSCQRARGNKCRKFTRTLNNAGGPEARTNYQRPSKPRSKKSTDDGLCRRRFYLPEQLKNCRFGFYRLSA